MSSVPDSSMPLAPASAPASSSGTAPLGMAGGYELLLEIASGGMATVFLGRAVDGRAGAPLVAIKRPHKHLATDKAYLSMLLDEARLASAIDHEDVVRVRELGFDRGEPFIVMDYVEGASLSELRKELASAQRAVDPRVATRVVLDALAGLHAAHILKDETGRHLGIIHRDVSPHNVLVGCDGRARITDFGIAKAEDRVQVTRTHEVKGKLAYLAPERIDRRRTCTVQSDVFSMAVVYWECIAGRRLFRGEEAIDTLQEVLNAPIPSLRKLGARISPELDDVILRALSRDLETRHRDAQELIEAIERAATPANIASRSEVARVIETVFGGRMRARQAQIRAAMKGHGVDQLFSLSGLPIRPVIDGAEVTPNDFERLASIAPPAPSARYSFAPHESPVITVRRKPPWAVLGSVAIGLLIGAVAVFAVLARRPAPIVVNAPPASAAPRAPEPTLRRVVVPLPFVATHVAFDDEQRDLDPAADVIAFEVPRESGSRHHLTATALDGSKASGFVREEDGVARVEAGGLSFELPPQAPLPARDAPPRAAARPAPVGTVKNGFTKLR